MKRHQTNCDLLEEGVRVASKAGRVEPPRNSKLRQSKTNAEDGSTITIAQNVAFSNSCQKAKDRLREGTTDCDTAAEVLRKRCVRVLAPSKRRWFRSRLALSATTHA